MTTPTTDQILTLQGINLRVDSFRFDVLDASLTMIGELHPTYATATIDNNINRAIKRTLSGVSLIPSEMASFNVFQHRVRPSMVLQDGTIWPLGVFMVADRSFARGSWLNQAGDQLTELGLVDQGLMLDQGLDRSVSYNAGASVTAALVGLATEAGLSAVVDGSTATIAEPVVWAAGQSTRLSVINELCAMAGFYSAYFDNSGVLRMRRAPDLSAATYDFDYDTYPRVGAGTIVETDDALKAPNRYVVVSSSATGAPVVGIWDVPATAPHSFANRGFRVVKTITTQGLDGVAATDAARVAGQTDSDTYAWADFTSVADPRHDTFNLVLWQGQIWREQSWSLALAPGGGQRHQLRRVF